MTTETRLGQPRLVEVRAANKAVLPGLGYLADAAKEAPFTREVFDLKSMTLDPDSVGHEVLRIFNTVPAVGKKRFYVDSYSKMETNGMFHLANALTIVLAPYVLSTIQSKQRFYKEFEAAGVELNFTNPPQSIKEHLVPVFNRDHIKGGRRDNEVFYFGGVNLDGATVNFAEFMVKFTGRVAEKLADEFDNLHTNPYPKDKEIPLTNNTYLYIDAGVPGQSVTRHKAMAITQNARKNILDSSFFPRGGTIARAFSDASTRGVNVESLTHILQLGIKDFLTPIGWHHLQWTLGQINRRAQIKNGYRFTTRVNPFRDQHGKLLIADDGGGEIALFGTNNLEDKGIDAGTREWSILTWDPELVANLKRQWFDFRMETNEALQEVL